MKKKGGAFKLPMWAMILIGLIVLAGISVGIAAAMGAFKSKGKPSPCDYVLLNKLLEKLISELNAVLSSNLITNHSENKHRMKKISDLLDQIANLIKLSEGHNCEAPSDNIHEMNSNLKKIMELIRNVINNYDNNSEISTRDEQIADLEENKDAAASILAEMDDVFITTQ